jgi:hypothetical protein
MPATLKVERRLRMNFIAGKVQEISGLTARYAQEFSGLPAAQMDAKPDPQRWSINECLDHIIQSNATYHPMFAAIAAGTYQATAWARVPLLPAFWGRMLLKSVSPDYKGKNKTFKVFYPAQSAYGRNLTQEFAAANEELIVRLQSVAHVNLDRLIVTSPAAKFVVYPLRACIDILVEHEKRHFDQAVRVKRGFAAAQAG